MNIPIERKDILKEQHNRDGINPIHLTTIIYLGEDPSNTYFEEISNVIY